MTEETKVSLTPEAIDELRALLDAATPGPWKHFHAGFAMPGAPIDEIQGRGKTIVAHWTGFDAATKPGMGTHDAALIVALHNLSPRVLEALEAGARLALAYREWKFLADKGDGMPVEVEQELTDAEEALLRVYGREVGS